MTISQGHAEGEHVNVTWILGKANGSPIKKVIIEHTTQFAPTTWNVISNGSEPQKGWVQIALSPHVRYTFRVVAVNDVGKSNASAPSSSFQAPSAGGLTLLPFFFNVRMITSRENYGHPVFEAQDSRWRSPDSSPGLVIQATFDVSKGSVSTARLKAVLT